MSCCRAKSCSGKEAMQQPVEQEQPAKGQPSAPDEGSSQAVGEGLPAELPLPPRTRPTPQLPPQAPARLPALLQALPPTPPPATTPS